MTSPSQKAMLMVLQFANYTSGWTTTNKPGENPTAQYEGSKMKLGRAKQCAIIAVDAILNEFSATRTGSLHGEDYWMEVRSEIIKFGMN